MPARAQPPLRAVARARAEEHVAPFPPVFSPLSLMLSSDSPQFLPCSYPLITASTPRSKQANKQTT